MKTSFLTLFLTALSVLPGTLPASDLPEAYPVARYDSLWKRSPFTLSSITDEQTSISGLAERYSLGGAFSVGTRDFVFVVNRNNPSERFLIGKEPNEQGMALESIQYDPVVEKTTAKIRIGEEKGTLFFDPASLKMSVAAAPATAPGTPTVMNPVVNRPALPTNPATPGARVIRRPRIIAPPPSVAPTTKP